MTLARCLDHLAQQTIVQAIEVIVVDDQGDEETRAMFLHRRGDLAVRHLIVEPCHQGQARNLGAEIASAPVILFIGDDIFLAPDACERHVHCHRDNASKDAAMLGHITWDPACGITPVMRWLERSGWQFGYPALDRLRGTASTVVVPRAVQHQYTYGSHLSLPREIALAHRFRTDVHLYGWEDTEWGMRLREAGVQMVYDPSARALHHHHLTLQDSLRRMETLGRAARIMQTLVPEFDRVPRGWKRLAYGVLSYFPTMAGRHRRAFGRGYTLKEYVRNSLR